jgi:hypothetical protein
MDLQTAKKLSPSGHALPCAADAVVVYETLPLEDEQVSRIGMSRPHPSLEKLENDLSNKIGPHPSLERLENDLSNKIRPHPSLERLENDSSKSWET